MKKHTISLIIILIGLLIVAGCGSSGEGDGIQTTTVSGTVLDKNGRPLKGAKVTISGEVVTDITDENGYFQAIVEVGMHEFDIRMDTALIYSGTFTCYKDTPLSLGSIITEYGAVSFEEWALVYDLPYSTQAKEVRQTPDGGYIIVTTYNKVMKLNIYGTIEWLKQYSDFILDSTNAIALTFDSEGNHDGYVVAGKKNAVMALPYPRDLWVFKLNLDGSVYWQKTYGNATGFNEANSIEQTDDGGFILAGQSIHLTGKSYDMWALKLEPEGAVIWEKTYGFYSDVALTIQESRDINGNPDGYIMAGIDGEGKAWVIKLTLDGHILWEQIIYGVIRSVRQTQDGGYIAAGTINVASGNSWHMDFTALKLNYNGGIEWQKAYGGSQEDRAFSVSQTFDFENNHDGYIVAGTTQSFGAGDIDVWILKLNMDGNIAWQKTYGGSMRDFAWSIQQTFDQENNPDGYIVAGDTDSFASPQAILILRLNRDGEIPGCNVMGTSEAIVTTPQIHPYNFHMTVIDSSATISNYNVAPEEIFADTNAICAWLPD